MSYLFGQQRQIDFRYRAKGLGTDPNKHVTVLPLSDGSFELELEIDPDWRDGRAITVKMTREQVDWLFGERPPDSHPEYRDSDE